VSAKLIALSFILCFSVNATAVMAQSTAKQSSKHTEKIKKQIFKSGIGPGNDIEVKLNDKTSINGYLSEVTENNFVVTDKVSGEKRTVEFAQVDKVTLLLGHPDPVREVRPSRVFKNLAIGFGIGVGVLVLACLATGRCQE